MSEIQILREIDHPNVIKLYEVHETTKYIHFVVELLRGGELFGLIRKAHRLEEIFARPLMKQLLNTMTYQHSKRIVHRDLKPENIMLKQEVNS